MKPDIVEVIGQRIELRRAGREWVGLCPFHADHHPSLRVNAEKQLWYCHSCAIGGDVIDFIQKIDDLSFPEACKSLGMETGARSQAPRITPSRRRAAVLAAVWALEQRAKLNTMIADALEQRDLADQLNDSDLAERYDREWFFLAEFYQSLGYPSGVIELLALRESIESITADAEVSL